MCIKTTRRSCFIVALVAQPGERGTMKATAGILAAARRRAALAA